MKRRYMLILQRDVLYRGMFFLIKHLVRVLSKYPSSRIENSIPCSVSGWIFKRFKSFFFQQRMKHFCSQLDNTKAIKSSILQGDGGARLLRHHPLKSSCAYTWCRYMGCPKTIIENISKYTEDVFRVLCIFRAWFVINN